MESAFDVLTHYVFSDFEYEGIDRPKYVIFYDGIVDRMLHQFGYFVTSYDPQVQSQRRIANAIFVLASLRPSCISHGVNLGVYSLAPVRTWGDYANAFRESLEKNNLIALGDDITFFKIVLFLRNFRSELSAPAEEVEQRKITLANRFIEFILTDVAPEAESVVAEEPEAESVVAEEPEAESVVAEEPEAESVVAEEPEAESVVAEEPEAESVVAEEPEAESVVAEEPEAESVVAEEPEAESVVAEEPDAESVVAEEPEAESVVAEEPEAENVVAEEPDAESVVAEEPEAESVVAEEPEAESVVAEEPEAESVVAEEPEAESVVADSDPCVDGDGDVVMETEKTAPESRRSKRCRSQFLTYEWEMWRVTNTKRRYNLRDTRAREERMMNLKEAEDSKRKADEAQSSSEGSRKRSRR